MRYFDRGIDHAADKKISISRFRLKPKSIIGGSVGYRGKCILSSGNPIHTAGHCSTFIIVLSCDDGYFGRGCSKRENNLYPMDGYDIMPGCTIINDIVRRFSSISNMRRRGQIG